MHKTTQVLHAMTNSLTIPSSHHGISRRHLPPCCLLVCSTSCSFPPLSFDSLPSWEESTYFFKDTDVVNICILYVVTCLVELLKSDNPTIAIFLVKAVLFQTFCKTMLYCLFPTHSCSLCDMKDSVLCLRDHTLLDSKVTEHKRVSHGNLCIQ